MMFASPWVLFALAGLPVLWWLLRVTPPAPRIERFPAIRLLHGLVAQAEQAVLDRRRLIAVGDSGRGQGTRQKLARVRQTLAKMRTVGRDCVQQGLPVAAQRLKGPAPHGHAQGCFTVLHRLQPGIAAGEQREFDRVVASSVRQGEIHLQPHRVVFRPRARHVP